MISFLQVLGRPNYSSLELILFPHDPSLNLLKAVIILVGSFSELPQAGHVIIVELTVEVVSVSLHREHRLQVVDVFIVKLAS